MTPAEAAALLGIASAIDGRKPDAVAAKIWSISLGDMRFEDARDAVVEHYQRTNDWLKPNHVIAIVKRIRASRIEDHAPITPPPNLDPIETAAWLVATRRRIADGEVLDTDATYGELKPRNLAELPAAMKALMPAPDTTTEETR